MSGAWWRRLLLREELAGRVESVRGGDLVLGAVKAGIPQAGQQPPRLLAASRPIALADHRQRRRRTCSGLDGDRPPDHRPAAGGVHDRRREYLHPARRQGIERWRRDEQRLGDREPLSPPCAVRGGRDGTGAGAHPRSPTG
ncbi:hypothetical protein PJ267_02195 [Arthrobacter sp. OVS8]|nr:hypothetical protein PJ267_02195 [Arthrobacter sp. OVS8]